MILPYDISASLCFYISALLIRWCTQKHVEYLNLSAPCIYWELISLIQIMRIIDLCSDNSLVKSIIMYLNYQWKAYSFCIWLITALTNLYDFDCLVGEQYSVIHTIALFSPITMLMLCYVKNSGCLFIFSSFIFICNCNSYFYYFNWWFYCSKYFIFLICHSAFFALSLVAFCRNWYFFKCTMLPV